MVGHYYGVQYTQGSVLLTHACMHYVQEDVRHDDHV